MRKVLTVLLTAGCFAAGTALMASPANAQVDAWNGGWHVGGDYYHPTDYSYAPAPIYDYDVTTPAAPVYGAPAYGTPAYGTSGYVYNTTPAYDYYGGVPAYSAAGYGYGVAPSYTYAPSPAYGPAVVAATVPAVRTIETVRTVYLPARSAALRHPTMRQTVVHHTTTAAYSPPQHDITVSSSIAAPTSQNAAYYDYAGSNYGNYGTGYAHPLYDTVAAPVAQPIAASVNITAPGYRYVYQPDRILVIDPATNTVVQALPR